MKTRVAINGFGRIGRATFKILFERSDVEVVAINDLSDNPTLAYLLNYDTNYGQYGHKVTSSDQGLIINGQTIKVISEKEPVKLPWKDLSVDIIIECTGKFEDPELAKGHILAGAKKVIISAPATADGATTVVLGVNDDKLASANDILSNGSCTTNCIAPVTAILQSELGIEKGMMTTVHSYTADQNLQDGPHHDLRRARAAAMNIVPTSTGAAKTVAKVVDGLEGIFDGLAIRVPTSVVSLCDFTVLVKRPTTVEQVNALFLETAKLPQYQGILAVSDEPLVSSDIKGNSHSAIVDLALTNVVGGNLVKVVAWYDNEWGYSNRLAEMVAELGKTLAKEQV